MSEHTAESDAGEEREVLADLIWVTARKFNPSDPRYADAILASGWLRDRMAGAWDEGHEAGYSDGQVDILTPVGLPGAENPYRVIPPAEGHGGQA